VVLAQAGVAEAVPPALLAATTAGSVAGVSAGGAGAVSAAAAGVARQELTAMFVKKLVLGVALGLGGLGLGVGAWFAAPLIAAADDKPDVKAEKEKLQGEWKVTSAKKGGQDADKPVGDVVKFDGDKFVVPDGECEYKLDPSKKPKQIDVSPLTGEEKGKTFLGVYALDGDKLTLHIAYPDSTERPTDLESKVGADTMLVVLERVKK
jgi:uncharacterized protein (TIGR03067 family)